MFPTLLLLASLRIVWGLVVVLAFVDFAFLWFCGEADRKRYMMQKTRLDELPVPVEKVWLKPEAVLVLILLAATIGVMLRIFFR